MGENEGRSNSSSGALLSARAIVGELEELLNYQWLYSKCHTSSTPPCKLHHRLYDMFAPTEEQRQLLNLLLWLNRVYVLAQILTLAYDMSDIENDYYKAVRTIVDLAREILKEVEK